MEKLKEDEIQFNRLQTDFIGFLNCTSIELASNNKCNLFKNKYDEINK